MRSCKISSTKVCRMEILCASLTTKTTIYENSYFLSMNSLSGHLYGTKCRLNGCCNLDGKPSSVSPNLRERWAFFLLNCCCLIDANLFFQLALKKEVQCCRIAWPWRAIDIAKTQDNTPIEFVALNGWDVQFDLNS